MFRATLLLSVGLLTVSICQAGAITQINLGDFASPTIVDFQTAPLGNISGTDLYFTSQGISSISGTGGSSSTDTFDLRANSSRALWAVGSNLVVVDPGATNLGDNPSYDISLTNLTFQFGFATHDQANMNVTVTFYNGLANVGSTVVTTTTTDLNPFYFANTDAFNRVTIQGDGGGYAIDNLTFASTAVPEPSSFLLMSMAGFAGLLFRKKLLRKN